MKGQKELVNQVTKVNGETTNSELISSKVVKKAQDKVVLQGTASVTAKAGVTYSFADGSDVVEYAKKFVGNPYRYGEQVLLTVPTAQVLYILFTSISALTFRALVSPVSERWFLQEREKGRYSNLLWTRGDLRRKRKKLYML